MGGAFDIIGNDAYFGERTWEKAESAMQRLAFSRALEKAKITASQLDYLFAGDLLCPQTQLQGMVWLQLRI